MPLFEYVCKKCGLRFEALILDAKPPICPSCRSSELEQVYSSFATSSGNKGNGVISSAGSACGSGGGGG
jgi:putative FmdB family regulatory protein